MSDTIIDIESGIDRLESLVRTLREDRDKARAEAMTLRRALDEREMELLQTDEELQLQKKRCADDIAEERKLREDLELRLAEVADRIRRIFPLLDEFDGAGSAASGGEPAETGDRT
jgi:predicted  nucleic acid-binding Zn-ribbon protein